MLVCDCGKKYVSQAKLDAHLVKVPHGVSELVDESVVIRFNQAVEITINGVQYFGTEVKTPNIQIASEVARIAREAYGRDVLNIN